MAKISELPIAGPLTGTEPVILVQDDEAKQSPIGTLVEQAAQPSVDQAQGFANATEIIGDQVAETASFIAAVLVAMGRFYGIRTDAVAALPVGQLFTSNEGGTFGVYERTSTAPYYAMRSVIGYSGSILTSLLTQGTGKLLGRTTEGTGAIEELAIGGLLSLSSGVLTGLLASHGLYNTGATGTYITAMIAAGSPTTVAVPTGTTQFIPIRPAKDITFDRLEVEVTTLVAGSTFHLAIYGDSGNKPDTTDVIARTTTALSGASTGIKDTGAEMTGTLLAGRTYWLAIATSGSITFRAPPLASLPIVGTTSAAMSVSCYRQATATFAQLPSTAPTTSVGTANTTVPIIRLRVA